jgi:beta-lactamase regulating signal transducer with metallopeptidase domain
MDAVLNWLWQGGVVTMALGAMLITMRRARANVRYVVCWSGALLVLALPGLPSLASTAAAPAVLETSPIDPVVTLPDAWWTSALLIAAAWAVWATVQLVRFVSAIVAIRRARAASLAFPAHVELQLPCWRAIRGQGRRARLVLSDSVTAAAVLGWGPPMIAVAPSLVDGLDAGELDRVLVHEWAHVQRRDDLFNVLQIGVRVVAGWHPALWWIDRRLQVEREIACDESTVAITGSPRAYAQCLLKLSGLTPARRDLRTAPAVFTASSLRVRLLQILSSRPSIAPRRARAIAAAALAVLSLTAAGVGGLELVEATALAIPFVSARAHTASPRPPSASAGPALASNPQTERAPRPAAPPGEPQVPEQSRPVPPPAAAPVAPPVTGTATPAETPGAARPVSENAVPELPPGTPYGPPPGTDVKVEEPKSPWAAAAAGGAAIGRKSKDAGLATAGFFTRLAKRVAGSY